ncbi:MAG TPA: ribosomal-processing cysteine protease Prp [Magnetospirillaceae bacterium]|nr:ribosomal-processing cysteine protease Prp [Magnetospirillaceae bacterium]
MVEIRARLGADGVLRRVDSSGHAGSEGRGRDLVCAAASALLRTAYETLAQVPGVRIDGLAPEPGSLWFVIRDFSTGTEDRLRGIGDFLLTGLSSLEREHPGALKLTTERDWRK